MTKLEEYKERKRIEKEGLPKLYRVRSNRDGVSAVEEIQTSRITKEIGRRLSPKPEAPIDRYHITDGYQYDIVRGESSKIDPAYGSGFGDLWSSTVAVFFVENDAKTWASEEHIRVLKQYGEGSVEETIIMPSC